jgi:NAD(P)-dependent dehydrogenase (short-subunit alcohol dehydrogenase family)
MKTSAASAHTCVIVGVGAERALGAALCRRFAAEGYHVLVAGRTPGKILLRPKPPCRRSRLCI